VRFIAGILCALTLPGIAGITFVYSGWFDVAASSPHSKIEQWVFNKTMKQSVVAQAAGIADPPTFTDEMVRDGFEHYDEMCTVCHAGPGLEQSEVSKGLNPPAPNLSDAVRDWSPRQLFWIVKHGVRMTAMPSFGATHDEDEVWSIVAFIQKLPQMSPEQYQQMKQQAGQNTQHMTR
jgi:mono/diheme cytochrome c family protein